MAKSKIFEVIKCLLDVNKYECCICNENTKEFYIICKPGCIGYSYCKKCINIIKTRNKCPFTNLSFSIDDICLDYKTNKSIDENLKLMEKLKNVIGKSIKNISINIEIT